MDIDKFFNSKDVAMYVKESRYSFTIKDLAWIIDQSEDTTIEEKTGAFKELIDTMPDCSTDERLRRVHVDTFHQFLKEYIQVKEKLTEDFYNPVAAVYTYSLADNGWREQGESEQGWFSMETKEYFSDLELCFAHYKAYARAYAKEHVRTVGFAKHALLTENEKYKMDAHISLEMTPDLEVINVRDHGTLTGKELIIDSAFTLMEKPSLPVPFKDGDILTDPSMDRPEFSYPFVLEKGGDKEEMTIGDECRFVHVSGDEETPHLIGLRNTLSADYEEAQEPLKGRYQLLKPISSSVRIDPETGQRMIDTELTLSAYHLLLREQMCRAELKNLEKDYTKEELEAVGLEG